LPKQSSSHIANYNLFSRLFNPLETITRKRRKNDDNDDDDNNNNDDDDNDNNNSKYTKHLTDNKCAIGPMEDIMDVLHVKTEDT
jgi:hypothetical protein